MYASLRMYESSAASESKVRSRDASGGSCSARSGEGAAQMAAMTTAKSGGSSSSAAVVVGDRAASTTFLCTSAPH